MFSSIRNWLLAGVLACNLGTAVSVSPPNTITSPAVLPTPGPAPAAEAQRHKDPAIACWSSWSTYRSLSTSSDTSILNLQNGTLTALPTYVETYFNIETVDYTNATYTELCSRYSWLTSRRPTTTFPTSYSTYYDYLTYYPPFISRTDVPPTCTYSRSSPQCSRIWSLWSQSSSALSTASNYYDALATIRADARPPCEEPQIPCSEIKDRQCTVKPDAGTLYYWPVTTVSGDFCQGNGSTVTGTPTIRGRPNTAVVSGVTLTSPSAYLVLKTLNGYYSSTRGGIFARYGKCGPTVKDVTLTLPPASVSSVAYKEPATGYPVNYADFNLVPIDSYKVACTYPRACSGWGRSGIRNYEPFLQVPHEVLKVQRREWGNCTGWGYVKPSLLALGVTTTKGRGTATGRPSKATGLPRVTARPTRGRVEDDGEDGDDEEDEEWRWNGLRSGGREGE